MELPTHEVSICGHHANEQWCKVARVVFGEDHSIFVGRFADPSDIPDEWTVRRILRELRDEHLEDSTVIIVFADRTAVRFHLRRIPVPGRWTRLRAGVAGIPRCHRHHQRVIVVDALAVPVCSGGLAVDGEAEGVVLDDDGVG